MDRPRRMMASNITEIAPVVHELIRLLPKTKPLTIVDLGCGFGNLGYVLRSQLGFKGYKLIGLDMRPVPQVIPILELVYDKFYQVSLEEFIDVAIKQGKKFTLVFGNQVFEHIPEEKSYSYLQRVKKITDIMFVGFPYGRKGYVYKQSDNPFDHKFAVNSAVMRKLGYERIERIKHPQAFVWKKEE